MTPAFPYAGFQEMGRALRAKEISSRELTEQSLARVEALDGKLNSFITLMAESALAAADAADEALATGKDLGPLHGLPLGLKDLVATKGVRTTAGSKLLADWVPARDAMVARKMKDAGAVILGKLNMHELAYGTTNVNPFYGAVTNPWRLDCHTGGSSGGSASAVAAGLVMGAIGSDTGCSIRQPAHCCGIVGLKPTFGRVSKADVVTLSWSMDHLGPMTRSVADAALFLQAIAGHDPEDPNSAARAVPDFSLDLDKGVKGLRIAVVRDFFFDDCEPDVVAAVEGAASVLSSLGAEVDELTIPNMEDAFAAGSVIIASEAASYHAKDLDERPEAFGDEVRGGFLIGKGFAATDFILAQRMRRMISAETVRLFEHWDAFLMPTSPLTAKPIDNTPRAHGMLRHRNCIPFNLTGLPALSQPCGFDSEGLPVGLQLVTAPWREAQLLSIGAAYEGATKWHRMAPKGLEALEGSQSA